MWIVTAVAALLSMPASYAVVRTYEVVFKSEPNPANVVWTPHIAFFWRLALSAYVAGLVGTLVYMGARRDLPRTARALLASVFVVGLMMGVQGLFMP